VPKYPSKVFFHCDTPAETGGEVGVHACVDVLCVYDHHHCHHRNHTNTYTHSQTHTCHTQTPILPSWEMVSALEAKHPEFVKKLEEGVRYIRVLPEEDDSSSGQSVYQYICISVCHIFISLSHSVTQSLSQSVASPPNVMRFGPVSHKTSRSLPSHLSPSLTPCTPPSTHTPHHTTPTPTPAIGRGWKSTYATSERLEVEERLRQLNYTGEWLPDGSLRTISPVLPAVRYDEGPGRSGRKVFFNSVVAVFTGWNDRRNQGETAVQFADGSYLDPAVVAEAAEMMDELAVAYPWQRGDVVLIDNHITMHSRKPFTGRRLITASLAKATRAAAAASS
jgi:hypothetical protein